MGDGGTDGDKAARLESDMMGSEVIGRSKLPGEELPGKDGGVEWRRSKTGSIKKTASKK